MNATFKVMTLFNCDHIEDYRETCNQDALWIQTAFGCRLLKILQDMYGFNMTYMIPNTQSSTEDERALSITPHVNDSIDIYAKPMSLTGWLLDTSCPIQDIFTWKYGFILKQQRSAVLRKFYNLPFTTPVWTCLFLMILVVSGIFFFLSEWEKKILGGYSSYHYELLLAIGACFQHILPLQANLLSRRIAYFSFIMGVYVIFNFYSSNLLSHLVSDKDSSMGLEMLANSDFEYINLGIFNVPQQNHEAKIQSTDISIIENKLSKAKYVNIVDGLNAVMAGKSAMLCDYPAVTPVLSQLYTPDDICGLIKIDLYKNIKKYFYTSKNFSYINQFKVGILRVRESGILQKILGNGISAPLNCAHTYPMRAEFEQIVKHLIILSVMYLTATVIMLLERWHHRRNKVWPFVN